jgi:hypothetical protein
MTRWKEDYEECIDINENYLNISNLIVENIKNPETLLMDRKIVLNQIKNKNTFWKYILYYKF